MRRTYSLGKRVIALLLSLVLILSVMPSAGLMSKVSAAGEDSGIIGTVADESTFDSWKNAFDPTDISTEHAGGVWTDKSVFTKDEALSANGALAGLGITADDNNFLVALSALAANSVVTGQGAMPTDTVLVLDISGSMSATSLRAMVSAANDAIHTLLSGNEKNRVGVVLYASSASVLLPLDRYTPVTDNGVTEYIEYSNSRIRAARVQTSGGNQGGPGNNQGGQGNNQNNYTYITNSSGSPVTTSVSVGGGTYIQGGLYAAWEQFNAATVTDQRTPVLVLMSDGAPTFVTNDFNNVPDSYESGDGNSSGDGEGFLTQLTAAYVKEKIAAKYSSGTYTAKSYLYTLGLGLSTGDTTPSVAEAVLNTGKTRSDITAYWNTYLALASQETKTMDVSVYEDSWWGSSTEDVTVTYDATLNSADQKAYVDKYFPASSASDLSTAFKGIVNEISLKSSYYVTRLDRQDTNMGGYVTFVDEIGTGMEVKEIEGILIGDTLYTGEKLAQAMVNGDFGTVENPTALGDNLVWAVVERLRIAASENQTAEEIARELLGEAYAAGQIGYNSTTGQWSNYIAWFGDKDGKYVGFWDMNDPYAPIPANAVYANACYGMLGTTTDDQTAHASDMMYVAIQVSKPVNQVNGQLTIQANSPQTVTFRVPASLLPTVTYQISVDVGSNGEITENSEATIAYKAAEPIRLVYEVGVHSELTPENISQFVREGYQAKDENGNYYLYTNAWNWEGADDYDWKDVTTHPERGDAVLNDTSKNAITYAYFEPGEDNEHYYFTEDSLVYTDKNGTLYTGNTQPSGTMYYKYLVYTATASGSSEVAATITAHYEELSGAALEKTVQASDASTWYVPKGTMHRNTHYHDSNKTTNETGSFFAIRHQLVDIAVNGDNSHQYEIVYMGNNGRVTYAPAQGVDLTKVMAEGDTAEGQSFSFTVEVSADADGKITVTRNGVSSAVSLTANKAELALAAGETVRITGMDIGETYTITENVPDGYKLSGIMSASGVTVNNAAGTATGTVQSNVIHAVTYTNAVVDYGSLLISKAVTYLKGSQPDAANAVKFPVTVTLNGMGGETVYADGTAVTLASDGTYTFDIVDGQNVLLSGIPADTAYTVEEATENLADGYTAVDDRFTGTIQADTTATAALKNQYEPASIIINDVKPAVTVDVTKEVHVDLGYTGYLFDAYEFDFQLLKYDTVEREWEAVANASVTVSQPATPDSEFYGNGNIKTAQISLNGVTLDSVGSHYFRVAEVIPDTIGAGWTYDRTFHDFVITVVDNGEGQLVIEDVTAVQHAQVSETVEDVWNVSTSFENSYVRNSTKLTIQANKTLTNLNTNMVMALKDGQFQFTLYTADENFTDSSLAKVEDSYNGVAGPVIFTPITYGMEGTYYYVVKETSTDGDGYKVDTTSYQIAVTVGLKDGENNLEIKEVKVNGDPVTLSAGNVLNGDTIKFQNTYQATTAQVQINGEKTLSNETPGAANTTMTVPSDAFSFKLTALDGAPLGNGSTSETVKNNGAQFAFSKITFNEAGTYHYTITEEDTSVPGMSKDPAVHNVTVVVTDDGKGTLTATVTNNGEAVNGTTVQTGFHNTYKAEPVTGVEIKGHKDLIVPSGLNRTLKAGEFHFTLAGEGISQTVSNDASGNFAFSALRFDTIGTYEYTVTETDAGAVKNGVTYDTASYQVTVTVTDNDADGKLEAAVAYQKVTATGTESASQANFQNTYAAASVTVQLTAHKYLTGDRDLKANEFSFTLTKPNGTETVTNAADGQVNFSAITYYGVGEHIYKIVENKLDDNGNPLQPNEDGLIIYKGVTYSLREYTVTVKVTDNGLGSLVAHVTTEDENRNEMPVQFFNRYEAESVTVNLTGENDKNGGKTLDDKTSGTKDLSDFEFKFVLTDSEGNVIETVSDNDADGFNFADITYTEPGKYVYYIHESNTGVSGITYDTATFKVTVDVTDKEEGQLEASLSYEKITTDANGVQSSQAVTQITFTNTYEADPAGIWISGIKTLTNETPGVTDKTMAVGAGKYFFKLTALDGAPMAAGNTTDHEIVTNDAEGKFAFSAIHFTKVGTYAYTVTEEDTSVPGVRKDETVHKITVEVKDENGQLVAHITCDNEPVNGNTVTTAFHNTYVAKSVTGLALVGSKNIVGNWDLKAGDFTFILERPNAGAGANELRVEVDDQGNFQFKLPEYSSVGTFIYEITEENGKIPGFTYDSKKITVVVTVEDNGSGQLIAKVGDVQISGSYDVGEFKNIYEKPTVTVNLTGENNKDGIKTLDDQTSQTDKTLKDFEFTFVLTDADGKEIETVTDNNGTGFNFKDITYEQPGEYVYYISEKPGTVAGVTYDTAKYQVTVKVTYNDELELVAAVTYEKITSDESGKEITEKAEEVSFTNTYKAKQTTVILTGLKLLNNGRTQVPDEFKFTLTKPDGTTETVGNDKNGNFTFSELIFTVEGEYVCTIIEEDTKVPGVTYDTKTIEVKITVVDENGQLVAKVGDETVNGSYHVGKFENSYGKSVTVNIEGDKANTEGKTLDDKTSLVDKTLNDFAFKFVLTDADGNVIEETTDNGSGFAFEDITFTEPTQKVYFIYEHDEDVPGVIYDTAKYKVIVKVTDNIGKEELEAEVTYEKITTDESGKEVYEKADAVTFANTYEAKETSVSFAGIKTFDGGRKLKPGEFSFILKDAAGNEIETVQNDADGKFTFAAIGYTQEGKYVYTLEEVEGEDDKVTYDGTKYTLTVTVTDEDGVLKTSTEITVDKKPVDSYGFTNLFTPESAKATITVEKVLENKSDKDMGLNGFQFDLVCEETGKIISAISGTDGLAELELTFTAADVGKTYNYKLTEHKGDVEGMTYSDAVYKIKVTVTQKAETGELVLDVTRDGTGNAKFINTYNKVTPPEDEIPKTGEEIFVGNWVAMMSVSAICLLAVLVLGKKKSTQQ